MSKEKQYDLTPQGWSNATRQKRREAAFLLLDRFPSHEVRSSPKHLLLLGEAVGEGGIAALHRLLSGMMTAAPSDAEEELAALSCRDGSCLLWPRSKPKGQCTQGGCRCFRGLDTEQKMRWQRIVMLLQDRK